MHFNIDKNTVVARRGQVAEWSKSKLDLEANKFGGGEAAVGLDSLKVDEIEVLDEEEVVPLSPKGKTWKYEGVKMLIDGNGEVEARENEPKKDCTENGDRPEEEKSVEAILFCD